MTDVNGRAEDFKATAVTKLVLRITEIPWQVSGFCSPGCANNHEVIVGGIKYLRYGLNVPAEPFIRRTS
jgi:hypothetical protein